LTLECSVKTHVGSFCGVPAGHFGSALEFDQFSGAGLVYGTLFFALVKELLLAVGKGYGICRDVLLVIVAPDHVFRAGVEALVSLAVQQTGPKSGPGGHK